MNTHEESPIRRSEIAKRVLIIQKDSARFEALRRTFSQPQMHGFEFIFADRLDDPPLPVDEAPPYIHCIDAAYQEEDIKAYVARRRAEDNAHTILALCGDADRPKARALFRHGIYDYLSTPFEAEEFIRVLERSHERARLARENARKREETAALEHAITSVIGSTKRIARHLSLEDFCRALMQELGSLCGAEGGSIYINEGHRLIRVYSLDPGHAPDSIDFPLLERSFLGLAQKAGRPILGSEIADGRDALSSGFSGYKDDSCLILPVFHNGEELVAFISLHDKQAAEFGERERTIGAALASVSAGYLHALRALASARERESLYEHFFKEGLTVNFIAFPDGRLSLANAAFSHLFCADAPPWASMSVVPLFAKKSDWPALVRRIAKEKAIENIETELIDSSGERRLLFGSLFANTNDKGELVTISAALFDITQKKLLERELNHSLKMEAIGRLAGGVAHDFNNLITAILGYCEVMKDRAADRQMAEEIEGIRRAGEKASTLTRQLLSLTRKQPQAAAPVNLARLVRELEQLLRRVIGENIELVSRLPVSEPFIRAERSEIEQVIMNLVVNARDAMPAGGRIIVSVSEEDAGRAGGKLAGARRRWVVLRVSDEGIGMDEETQRRIFDPFFSTKDKGKGTGLGLSLVYGIVKRSGGYIAVESSPDRGSTFSLFFPKAAAGRRKPASAPESIPPCFGDELILVVDDEQVVRDIVSRVLKKYGYSVCEAANGEEALALARAATAPFACAVIDLVMPGMSGTELAAALGNIFPGISVLFVSGYAQEDASEYARRGAGAAEIITKPFHSDELARKVREILDRKGKYGSEAARRHS